MENYSHRLMLGCSATALLLSLGSTAYAQETTETVIVSSTRLQNAGFDAPTPTTVIGAADIAKNAQTNVFEAITQLPALQGSTGAAYNTGSTTTGLQGLSALGLRGLSPLRTLVLLDNQRVVGGNFNGAVDVSQMPQMLISRVDIVTGGASASWGSDAVAGVVNFVTEKKYEGFKMNATTGISTYSDDPSSLLQFAAGSSFLGGRAHIEASAEYEYNAGLQPQPDSSRFSALPNIGSRHIYSQQSVANFTTTGSGSAPAGFPQYVYGPITQGTTVGNYGLVTNGPKVGNAFGANGQAVPFQYAGVCSVVQPGTTVINPFNGSTYANYAIANAINGTCYGVIPGQPFGVNGTVVNLGDQQDAHSNTQGLVSPLQRGNFYTRVSYDLAPGTEIYATVNLGQVRSSNVPAQGNSDRSGLTIRCDNAFLPQTGLFGVGQTYAQTIAACNTDYAGLGGLTNSTASPTATGASVQGFQFGTREGNINVNQIVNLQRDQRRYVVGADGAFNMFGTDWSWDTYAEHGETDTGIHIRNMPLSGRFNLAMDAIQDPVTGQIECRNVAARAQGCVPYNPFGTSTPAPASIAYFDNQSLGNTIGPWAIMKQRQEAFSASFNGSPLEDWAGKVSVAAGVEYREEAYSQTADPYSAGTTVKDSHGTVTTVTAPSLAEPCTDPSIDCVNGNNWNAGNYHNGIGSYHVSEAFVELGVPLINTPELGKLDLDLAGRVEAYSGAHQANTWKVGLTYDTPIPGIRLRALQSRDVRAPNLSELFSPPQGLNGSINNDFTGVSGQTVRQLNEGNTVLSPEVGTTTQAGVVFQPEWLPGFQASIDYYRISVRGVIAALGLQNVEDLCYNGFVKYCGQDAITTANGVNQSASNPGGPTIVVNGVTVPNPGVITAVHSKVFNQAGLLTDGFDLEAAYNFDLQDWDVPGSFQLRSLANHVSKFISNPGVIGQANNVELAGVLGGVGGAGTSGGNSQTYNQTGGNVLTWKLDETQSYDTDSWGVILTERWYAGGQFASKNFILCDIGTCPAATIQNPTINYDKVDAAFYLDVGANWKISEKSQLYFKIDNITNLPPPLTGAAQVNNTLYDAIGRYYRIGFRFND